jgi:hypothetical protein
VDVFALLGEEAWAQTLQYQVVRALGLTVRVPVGDCCPFYSDVVVISKIQELLPSELGAVVGDEWVGDPKAENNVLDKIHYLFGADFDQGSCVDPLSEFVDRDKQVGQAPGRFLEGFQEIQVPHDKRPHDGDGLELLGWRVDLSHKVLVHPAGPHHLNHVSSGRQQVKTLPERFSNHVPWQSMMLTNLLTNIDV